MTVNINPNSEPIFQSGGSIYVNGRSLDHIMEFAKNSKPLGEGEIKKLMERMPNSQSITPSSHQGIKLSMELTPEASNRLNNANLVHKELLEGLDGFKQPNINREMTQRQDKPKVDEKLQRRIALNQQAEKQNQQQRTSGQNSPSTNQPSVQARQQSHQQLGEEEKRMSDRNARLAAKGLGPSGSPLSKGAHPLQPQQQMPRQNSPSTNQPSVQPRQQSHQQPVEERMSDSAPLFPAQRIGPSRTPPQQQIPRQNSPSTNQAFVQPRQSSPPSRQQIHVFQSNQSSSGNITSDPRISREDNEKAKEQFKSDMSFVGVSSAKLNELLANRDMVSLSNLFKAYADGNEQAKVEMNAMSKTLNCKVEQITDAWELARMKCDFASNHPWHI